MNDQTKKIIYICGGLGLGIVLIVLLFVIGGGPSCEPVFANQTSLNIEAKNVADFKSSSFKVKFSAFFEYGLKDVPEPKRIKSEGGKLIQEVNNALEFSSNCISKIVLSYQNETDAKVKTVTGIKLTMTTKQVNENKEFSCDLAGFPKSTIDAKFCKFSNMTLECKDGETLRGKLITPIFYLGNAEADFDKADTGKDCLTQKSVVTAQGK